MNEQSNKYNARDKVSDGILTKPDISVSKIFVATSQTIVLGTFKLATVEKPTVKALCIATFFFTKLGRCASRSTKENLGELRYTEKGPLTRKGLSNLVYQY